MNGRSLLLAAVPVLMCLACSLGGAPSPSPAPTPAPSPGPTTNPDGFYLRLYTTQALPAGDTFGWLPSITISANTLIDGNVAIPMVYPGPLLISPVARFISDDGIAAIIAEARGLGLLDGPTDFSGGSMMPGSAVAHVTIVVDGVEHDLIGNADLAVNCGLPGQCAAAPGTPAAFSAFWQAMTNLDPWLGGQLGGSVSYAPERLAVMLVPPATAVAGLSPHRQPWPLSSTFADFGVPFVNTRCATVSGA